MFLTPKNTKSPWKSRNFVIGCNFVVPICLPLPSSNQRPIRFALSGKLFGDTVVTSTLPSAALISPHFIRLRRRSDRFQLTAADKLCLSVLGAWGCLPRWSWSESSKEKKKESSFCYTSRGSERRKDQPRTRSTDVDSIFPQAKDVRNEVTRKLRRLRWFLPLGEA